MLVFHVLKVLLQIFKFESFPSLKAFTFFWKCISIWNVYILHDGVLLYHKLVGRITHPFQFQSDPCSYL